MPASASVLAKRLYVPPYTVEEETMWSPARAMFWMAYVTAAAPVETASAAAPPVSYTHLTLPTTPYV